MLNNLKFSTTRSSPQSPFNSSYRPVFTGHETFPLRYGWLKKACDSVNNKRSDDENSSIFSGEDAIARFGVGKNMVAAIRHWADMTGFLEDKRQTNTLEVTELGNLLFGENGYDPYMEHSTSTWLVHWNLVSNHQKITWYWAFNHFASTEFDRDHLVQEINRLIKDCGWRRIASTTVKNDVVCFIRTYASAHTSNQSLGDNMLESPLVELKLIKSTGKRDGFRFVRGPKSNLCNGMFAYAVLQYWLKCSNHSNTLSFEAVAHAPGSPGRAFLLEENDIVDRLVNIEEVTAGRVRWSETAGLKQIVRDGVFNESELLSLLKHDYTQSYRREVVL